MDKPVQKAAINKEEEEALLTNIEPRRSIYNMIMTALGVFICMSFTFAGLVVVGFTFSTNSWITWVLLGILCVSALIAGIGILAENRRLVAHGAGKLFELRKKKPQD